MRTYRKRGRGRAHMIRVVGRQKDVLRANLRRRQRHGHQELGGARKVIRSFRAVTKSTSLLAHRKVGGLQFEGGTSYVAGTAAAAAPARRVIAHRRKEGDQRETQDPALDWAMDWARDSWRRGNGSRVLGGRGAAAEPSRGASRPSGSERQGAAWAGTRSRAGGG